MEIKRFKPKAPEVVTMTFPVNDGWAVLMALNDAVRKYPGAAENAKWKEWAVDLEMTLRG